MRRIKRYFKYTGNYLKNLAAYKKSLLQKKKTYENNKIIFIDIKSNVYRRHLANLIFWFTEQGYVVYLKQRFKAIGSMHSFARKVFYLPGLRLSFKKPPKTYLVFTGRPAAKANEIYLNPDYFSANELNHIPLGMQPDMYFKGYYKQAKDFVGKGNRRIGVFFSGNMTENLYSKEIINSKFSKLTRIEVFQMLQSEMPDKLVIPENKAELYRKQLRHKIVFNDRLKIMIPQKEFLKFLSDCSFFLFTPGVTHPICHNNFEAMAVGTIPILQSPEYFYPALEHKKNCLVFHNKHDLTETIKSALTMPEEDIERMRQNVIDYYNKYLSVESIVDNIIDAYAKGTREFYFGLD